MMSSVPVLVPYVCPRGPHAEKSGQAKHTGLERSCIQEQVFVCTMRPQRGAQALRGAPPRHVVNPDERLYQGRRWLKAAGGG